MQKGQILKHVQHAAVDKAKCQIVQMVVMKKHMFDTYVHTARHVGAELKCHGADLNWLLSLQCCCRPKTPACYKCA